MRSLSAIALATGVFACSPAPRVSAASEQVFVESVPLCNLLKDPKPFVGKHVNVRGYYFPTPHGGLFHDSSCERGEIPLARDRYEDDDKRAIAILHAAWRGKRIDVPVVMSGTLKDNFDGDTPGFRCSGGGVCQRYSLESDFLLAARPVERRR